MTSVCYYSKDVRLPVQLQRAMAAEAEAAREARAKVKQRLIRLMKKVASTHVLNSNFKIYYYFCLHSVQYLLDYSIVVGH